MDLDLKDRKILLELDLNAKIPIKELAKKAKLSKEAVLYRIKRLENNGVITGYNTIINFSRLGYTGFGIFCRLEEVDEHEKEKILNELKDFPQVYWIGTCIGRFDIAIGIMCKSVFEFNRMYYDFKNKYSGHISETSVAIRVELRQNTRNYLIKDERARNLPSLFFGKEPELETIDETDHEIMATISTNARMPITEIGKRLGKPASTIALRIKKLEEKNLIQTYDTVVKVQKYGIQSYRIMMILNNIDEQLRSRLFSYAQQNPRIWLAAETVGNWNFEIVFEVESPQAFEEELSKFKNLFGKAIDRMEMLVMPEEDYYLNMWPFGKNMPNKI